MPISPAWREAWLVRGRADRKARRYCGGAAPRHRASESRHAGLGGLWIWACAVIKAFVGLGALGIRACAVTRTGSAETLLISLFTKLRNSELNCAPGCESLLAMYSMF